MRIIYMLCITLCYTLTLHPCDQVHANNHQTEQYSPDDYFDTKKISDPKTAIKLFNQARVYKRLGPETSDNARLEVYARILENPTCSIILPAGFYPGKLYGMVPYCQLCDSNSNLFFFHARDRGNSYSPISKYNVWQYGRHHWKDIQAMLEYAHTNSPENTPIYIIGVCSGAFHSLHAINRMGNAAHDYNLKGIVADSTMTSVHEMAETAIPQELTKSLDKKGYTWRAMAYRAALHLIGYTIFYPFTQRLEQETRLTQKRIENIPVPICFIHGTHDPYSNIKNMRQIRRQQDELHAFDSDPNSSIHAVIHIKQKDHYQNVLNSFIQKTLSRDS